MSKGSTRRPSHVPPAEVSKNWDAIDWKDKEKK